ncbi:MAG: hypothetical protein JEZ02_21755 [Desulfatibacillum sp.]|nr:hypothetical protein [Desulfatibacillum sp.]
MDSRISQLAPSGWTYSQWRKFFVIAALWNILSAVPATLWPEFNMKIFYDVLYGDDYAVMLNRCFWISVLIFGIGYAIVSNAPEKNQGIIVMGVLGKIAVTINWISLVLDGDATFVAFLGAAGDSIFTVYFIYFLASGPHNPQTDS